MKTIKTAFNLCLIALILISLTKCKNKTIDEDVVLDIDTEIIKFDADVEVTVAEIINIADQAEIYGTVTKKTFDENDILEECATVHKDTILGYPNTTIITTIDFGQSNCQGQDNRKRRGKIKVTSVVQLSPSFDVISREIESDGYHLQENEIKIMMSLQKGTVDSIIEFSVDGNVKIIYNTSQDSCEHTFSRTSSLINGSDTRFDLTDDVWEIGGSTSGYRKDGKNYESEITEALVKKYYCRVFDMGKIVFSIEGENDYEIDFGAGENASCNSTVDINVNGETVEQIDINIE